MSSESDEIIDEIIKICIKRIELCLKCSCGSYTYDPKADILHVEIEINNASNLGWAKTEEREVVTDISLFGQSAKLSNNKESGKLTMSVNGCLKTYRDTLNFAWYSSCCLA